MSSRNLKILGIAAASSLLAIGLWFGNLQAVQATAGRGPAVSLGAHLTTTAQDQSGLSVTVYNSNMALVRDERQLRLQAGEFLLWFEDVASSINPATVHFRSLTSPAKMSVVEQNYEYDLLDSQKLLQKYVGREVSFTLGGVEVKGLLLSDNNGPVWKIGDQIVTGVQSGPYRFPNLPDNLYSRPTLVWTLDNRGTDAQRVEASYLTGNMSWNADYVLTVGRDEQTADLDGWVTVVNNSGARYDNASLQLVAGELHTSPPRISYKALSAPAIEGAADEAKQFAQENFSEYHLYTLERRTSIQNNESKQIRLLTATAVPIEKYLEVEGQPYLYRNPQGIGTAISEPVMVFCRMKNEAKAGLGMPLPAGTMRVYEADSKGGLQFAGEDHIGHTPKEETVRVYTGNAFDVVCERKAMDYKKLGPNLFEIECQIALRNHSHHPATVQAREPIGGDWEVVHSNYNATKLDAATIGFSIPLEKDGNATLDYRVRVKW